MCVCVVCMCFFCWCRCAGRVEVRVARAGDVIEESPAGNNASAGANGVGEAGRVNADAAETMSTTATASEVR